MTRKKGNIKKIETELTKINNEPMTWEILDQIVNLLFEAMSILNIIEFIQWVEKMDYTQSSLKQYFLLSSMRKHFEEKLTVMQVDVILHHSWPVILKAANSFR